MSDVNPYTAITRACFVRDITTQSDVLADKVLIAETAEAMSIKLSQKRDDGRTGWWHDDPEILSFLWELATDHFERAKTDPHQLIDCINLLAMIKLRMHWNHGLKKAGS